MIYDFWKSLGFDFPPLNPDIADPGSAAGLAAQTDPTQFFSGDLDAPSMLASFGADLPADFMSTAPGPAQFVLSSAHRIRG
ncbi:hypothetical protein [Mycobacterium shimoidei]|uniref:Uncharacterized protein n=1 Tax=Mycobacterium shimoidei TaxID=29313 RepID=A0A1E3TF62_MYCSH|nr:hypothetical protein [Mycobacterium shimoidei]MCV7260380.1 hypothetical protein [Mycobacterium shimoidei]ODR12987.1 hypothetical protein BHQ16_13065 [Mycobacterium shimoidei]ORW82134.1 hypothetical protein AWC26_05640 [Mycobacterium shimoidei]SRX95451.1 hypothetical protein MSP7336_03720 [Mycobacterium shimoidei]